MHPDNNLGRVNPETCPTVPSHLATAPDGSPSTQLVAHPPVAERKLASKAKIASWMSSTNDSDDDYFGTTHSHFITAHRYFTTVNHNFTTVRRYYSTVTLNYSIVTSSLHSYIFQLLFCTRVKRPSRRGITHC